MFNLKSKVVKICFFIFINIFILCCTSYKVRVNGYGNIEKKKSIAIIRNPNAHNLLFEEEIARKLENQLKSKGYSVINYNENPQYILFYNYGIAPAGSNVIHYQNPYYPYQSFSKTVTKYYRFLILKVFETHNFTKDSKPVWIGEIDSTGSNSDFREVIDYLILGAFERFGENTDSAKYYEY